MRCQSGVLQADSEGKLQTLEKKKIFLMSAECDYGECEQIHSDNERIIK